MNKKKLLFFIAGLAGILCACQQPLAAQAVSGEVFVEGQASGGLPRWHASLAEIQEASKSLLEINSKLMSESRQLTAQLNDLISRAEAQRAKNASDSGEIDDMRARKQDESLVSDIARFKEILADREQQLAAQKEILASLTARKAAVQARVGLAELNLAELELNRKSKEVDVKARNESALNLLRSENAQIKDRIAKSESQVRALREKADELKRINNPYAAQNRDIIAQNAQLKGRLDALQAGRTAQQAAFEDLTARRLKLEKESNVLRVSQGLASRTELEAKLRDNSIRLLALKNELLDNSKGISAAEQEEFAKIEKQNAAMDDDIPNLRENIALLEYKINALQRYKDRNKPGR